MEEEEEKEVVWPEAPVDGDVIVQQDIAQASFRAVFCDDADVRHLDRPANELA